MNFFYEATDATGNTVVGKIDAESEQEAKRNLMLMGYRPRSLAPNPGAVSIPPPVVHEEPEEPSLATGHSKAPDRSAAVAGVMGTPPVPAMSGGVGTNAYPAAQNYTGMHALGGAQVAMQTGGAARSGGITLAGNAARLGVGSVNKTQQRNAALGASNPNASKLAGVSNRELMLFFQQLASLVKSGMTIYTALENLGPRTKNANLSKVAREMAEAAHAGRRVSDVMALYPRIFPDHIVGMVRAGEMGGFLEISLAEIAQNYEQNVSLYRGSWLPKLMATQSFLMLALVIPLIPSLFAVKDNFTVGGFLSLYMKQEAVVLAIFGAIYLGIRWGSRHLQLPHLRYFRDSWALRIPPFGDLQRQVALFNFVKMLRKLYHAGVAPIHAWEGAMNTASNVVIRDKLATSYEMMQKGASFSDAFTATGLFADNVEQLIVTGQHSGEMIESLDRAADAYDERVQEARSRSRMMIIRMGVIAMLILGGGAMIWLTYSYGYLQIHFTDGWTD
ncbi:MAG TPA: type II secretion system F family protein [Chthonomonadaceae bacterium]|nr:type II secretion system F family protein [Chthonomonadaceae bacterium]